MQVTILGEELADGTLTPPRLRPLPNSPVFALTDAEVGDACCRADGDMRLGLVVGHEDVVVGVPSDDKAVLPRHTRRSWARPAAANRRPWPAWSQQAQAAGMAVILLDVEGEYTHLHEPTDDTTMLAALAERGLTPARPAGGPDDASTTSSAARRRTRAIRTGASSRCSSPGCRPTRSWRCSA